MSVRSTLNDGRTTSLSIRTPVSFDFWHTAYSHGWCALVPFFHDPEDERLERIVRLADGTLVHCSLRGKGKTVSIKATSAQALSVPHRAEILSQLRCCLRLDEDFTPFHRAASRIPKFRWIAASGAGRLLRSPTVFEDVVKMICTTNCSWKLTTLMITNLVGIAGTPFAGGVSAFPTPQQVAAISERTMRNRVRAGYRSPYLVEFARAVSSGALEVESWRKSTLPTQELYRTMLAIKGIGPYAAGNLLKLVGRYDELGLDSWVRKKFGELYGNGRRPKDSTIERHYEPLGQWRGLFFWMDMTRDWHDQKFRL